MDLEIFMGLKKQLFPSLRWSSGCFFLGKSSPEITKLAGFSDFPMNIGASGLNCPCNQSNELGNHPKLGRFSINFIRKKSWLLTWFPPTLGGLRQRTHTSNSKRNWEASTGAFYDFKWEEPPFWIANIEMFFGGSPRMPKVTKGGIHPKWGLDRSQLWLQDFLHGFIMTGMTSLDSGMIFTGG